MAKAIRYHNPRPQYFISGVPASGAKLFFYTVGTTTKKDTYTDETKNTANPNPVILDSEGRPSNSGTPIDIYLDGAYKVVFAPSTDTDPPANAVWTEASVTGLGQLESTSSKSTDYTILETDRDKTILVDASGGSKTMTLMAAASAGDGYCITFKKSDSSTNTITIDGNSSETIDSATTYTLSYFNESVSLICNGTGWYVKYRSNPIAAAVYEDNRTNTVVYPVVIQATTTNTPAAGIGVGMQFKAESADENPCIFGSTEFCASDVGAGTEDTYFSVLTRTAGASLAEAYRWTVTGVGKYSTTGAPTSTRTITYPDANITYGGAFTTVGAFSTDAALSFTFGNTAEFAGTLTASRVYTFPDADFGYRTATQAEMETPSSSALIVSPASVNWHPGVAKAWVLFTSVTTTAITASHNITSLTDIGTGATTITIATDFSSANYCTNISTGSSSNSALFWCQILAGNAPAAGSIVVATYNAAGVVSDIDNTAVVMFGDQA